MDVEECLDMVFRVMDDSIKARDILRDFKLRFNESEDIFGFKDLGDGFKDLS